jgi:hypothetical protein
MTFKRETPPARAVLSGPPAAATAAVPAAFVSAAFGRAVSSVHAKDGSARAM